MKTIRIKKINGNTIDIEENDQDNKILAMIDNLDILESDIIYFSAGECKIKEVLVKRDPFYSA